MRENCKDMLGVANMSSSLKARATPTEIAAECPTNTLNSLVNYVESFSNNSGTITDQQVNVALFFLPHKWMDDSIFEVDISFKHRFHPCLPIQIGVRRVGDASAAA